jgi:AcrR family transcriptional regulator
MTRVKSERSGMAQYRGERSRASIRRAATALFIEDGYPNTSMDTIARRAKVARATIYNNFDDKTQILASIIEEYLQGYVAFLEHLPNTERSSPRASFDLIRDFIREAMRWRVQHAHLRPLFEQAKHLKESGWERINTYADAAMIDWLLTIHRGDAELGLVREEVDLVFATGAVYSMIESSLGVIDERREEENVNRASYDLALLYWHAIYRIPVPDVMSASVRKRKAGSGKRPKGTRKATSR